jgi:hypothetical protein
MISVSTSADGDQVYLRIENLSKDCVTCDGACCTRKILAAILNLCSANAA